MAELIEQDPRLARIIDPATSRDLLTDAHPLEVPPGSGKTSTIKLSLENGIEAPIELTISSDQGWLEPRARQIALVGGETRECQLVVHARVAPTKEGVWPKPAWMMNNSGATDNNTDEFANLCFTWKGASETYQEYVLVWRK
jgi:hypothetical protein